MAGERRPSTLGYPSGRPFALLVVYFVIAAVQLAVVAFRPPFPNTPVRALWSLSAVCAVLVLAVALAWIRRATAVLPVLVALGMLVSAASAAVSVGGQGQLVAGFYLAVLGMFAGYFLSARAVTVLVIMGTVAYGSALVLDWRLDSPAYVLAVVVLVDGVTLVVSSLVQRLRKEAVLDPLTGALNRRGLAERAAIVHALDGRHGAATTIVEIDLDGFKGYNDTMGHEAGDRLLADLSRAWASVLRRTDLLARTGGDEFVAVLPGTTCEEAEALVGRMREASTCAWSAGIADWRPGEELPTALRRADALMYSAKQGARPRSDTVEA